MSAEYPSEEEYRGMTLNERLFTSGLMEEYGQAARDRDRDRMIAILERLALSNEQAAWSVDTILSNPSRYGY